MRIHDNTYAYVERISEDDIRRLSTDTGKLDQLRHGVRNFAAVPLDESR